MGNKVSTPNDFRSKVIHHYQKRKFISKGEAAQLNKDLDALCGIHAEFTQPLHDEIQHLRNTIQGQESSVINAQGAARDAQRVARDAQAALEEERGSRRQEIAGLNWRHEAAINASNEEHQRRMIEASERHTREANQAREAHSVKIGEINSRHSLETETLKRDYESTIFEKTQQHGITVNQMREHHRSEMDGKVNQYESRLKKLREECQSLEKQKKTEIDQLNEQYTAEQETMNKGFQDERDQFAEQQRLRDLKHDEQMVRLRKEVNGFSKALVTKDEAFKAQYMGFGGLVRLPDEEIKARYLDLAQTIDDVARVDWKHDRSVWTDDILRSVGSKQSPRMLKKNIFVDIIWSALHEHIFCSPFRVFGKEGKILEEQWYRECARDPQIDNGLFEWPPPALETERWRYITIMECRAALIKPIASEWDPRARLKKAFKKNTDDLKAKLGSSVGEVADLDKGKVQTLESLPTKAAKMWLEFCMQRYRTMILLQESGLDPATGESNGASGDSLALTVVPSLGRYGNADGYDLHDDLKIIVAGKGEFIRSH